AALHLHTAHLVAVVKSTFHYATGWISADLMPVEIQPFELPGCKWLHAVLLVGLQSLGVEARLLAHPRLAHHQKLLSAFQARYQSQCYQASLWLLPAHLHQRNHA